VLLSQQMGHELGELTEPEFAGHFSGNKAVTLVQQLLQQLLLKGYVALG